MKLLIIEDKEIDVLFVKKTLAKVDPNIEVSNAYTAKDGLEIIERESFDCILLDINLPDGRGAEVFQKIFALVPHIPIITLTGSDNEAQGLELMDIGAQDFLKKEDISGSNLLKSIRFAINRIKTENKLRELNATKDKFISLMAHDLKNPLSIFALATDTLVKEFDHLEKEELKDYVTDLNDNAQSIFKLLENLLTWSRTQRGKIEYNPDLVDVSYILKNVIELYTKAAHDKNIEIVAPKVLEAKAFTDTNLISTILRNLINNAIKFTEIGGKIEIDLVSNTSEYTISVTDNGIGMSDEQMVNVFRIDKNQSTLGTSQEVGSGLGLVVCKEFAELLGGKIWVESVLMEGTTFSFSIPKKGA